MFTTIQRQPEQKTLSGALRAASNVVLSSQANKSDWDKYTKILAEP